MPSPTSRGDAPAWADWMGLRSVTGLAFEKAARGPKPAQFRELVWEVSEVDADEHVKRDRCILAPGGTRRSPAVGFRAVRTVE